MSSIVDYVKTIFVKYNILDKIYGLDKKINPVISSKKIYKSRK